MPGVKELTQKAEELMKKEAVLVTAAEYKDGVLRLTMPKINESDKVARRIDIQ